MSRRSEIDARNEVLRWLGVAVLGLVAIGAGGLMVFDSGFLAYSIVFFLFLGGALALGTAAVGLWQVARATG